MNPEEKGTGSSPHTRGAQADQRQNRELARIIPAYAGSTLGCGPPGCSGWDHPRIRGEHSLSLLGFTIALGSSPHTRGAQVHYGASGRHGRIIPAYAGSTLAVLHEEVRARDHPRIRGEHPARGRAGGQFGGSSPHTRGARGRPAPRPARPGIIPAYAGSTRPAPRPMGLTMDHPRIRGEHRRDRRGATSATGSSPHTRGAPPSTGNVLPRPGIIPAYAGSTGSGAGRRARAGDHPRIRGEHFQEVVRGSVALGSSPHTRGAPPQQQGSSAGTRIIPAYAGSTLYEVYCYREIGDHPRIRGEHTWKSLQYQGSPP